MTIETEITGKENLWDQINAEVAEKKVSESILRAAIRLSNIVKEDKLSGQVLDKKTGTLRRSINARVEGLQGWVGSFAGYFTPGPHPEPASGYARLHEFGATVNVPEHTRRCTMVFGRELASPIEVLVKAHSATYPERSFLRSALREQKPMISKELMLGLKRAMKIGAL